MAVMVNKEVCLECWIHSSGVVRGFDFAGFEILLLELFLEEYLVAFP